MFRQMTGQSSEDMALNNNIASNDNLNYGTNQGYADGEH